MSKRATSELSKRSLDAEIYLITRKKTQKLRRGKLFYKRCVADGYTFRMCPDLLLGERDYSLDSAARN